MTYPHAGDMRCGVLPSGPRLITMMLEYQMIARTTQKSRKDIHKKLKQIFLDFA
tara:strand:+ start:138 stop:299 length:162 start_codon:yes stop_codon:yes gene_type:complete